MVARDGIEPPTPAFSGLLTDNAKRFGISGSQWQQRDYIPLHLGRFRTTWAIFAPAMFPYCSHDSIRCGLRAAIYTCLRTGGWVRLHERGGKVNELPCHDNLEKCPMNGLQSSGLASEPNALPAFRHGKLRNRATPCRANVHSVIHRTAIAAGIARRISCHCSRATGLYDRRNDAVAPDEVERVIY